MLLDECREQRRAQEALGCRGDMEAKCATRRVAQLARRGDSSLEIVERGPGRRIQSLSGRGETDTARGAMNQRQPEPLFQPAQ